jgi:enoyl-CoA hydratase/carnithine racemase
MPSKNLVLFGLKDGIATVTLNRPEKANAFDGEMWLALEEAAEAIKLDVNIKAAILTGSGKAFCGGLDINQAAAEGICLGDRTLRPGFECLQYVSRVFTMYEQLPVPVIAAVNGGCIGLGFELALACDIRIAAESAVFSIPEVQFGLVPDCGGTQRLPRLVGPAMAKELIFTGKRLSAREAEELGIVRKVTTAQKLLEEAELLAAEIMNNAPLAVWQAKKAINLGLNVDLSTGFTLEAECYNVCLKSADRDEGLKAFNEKRKPVFTGQ